MAIKSKELESGCMDKAADDEPVFVLRAQDKTAPDLVRRWASMLAAWNPKNPKVQEALDLADAMEAWPTRKYPD